MKLIKTYFVLNVSQKFFALMCLTVFLHSRLMFRFSLKGQTRFSAVNSPGKIQVRNCLNHSNITEGLKVVQENICSIFVSIKRIIICLQFTCHKSHPTVWTCDPLYPEARMCSSILQCCPYIYMFSFYLEVTLNMEVDSFSHLVLSLYFS